MKLTPAIKGQLTKALKYSHECIDYDVDRRSLRYFEVHGVSAVFRKIMPRQQAKHATRKYLAN